MSDTDTDTDTETETKAEAEVYDASMQVKELRESFASGKTRCYKWRVSQLESLFKLSVVHKEDICDALRSDLSKPVMEAIIHEVFVLKLDFFTVLMICRFSCLDYSFFSVFSLPPMIFVIRVSLDL